MVSLLLLSATVVHGQSDVCGNDCANFTASYNLCQTLSTDDAQYLCTCDAYKGIGDTVPIPPRPIFSFLGSFDLFFVVFELLGFGDAGYRYSNDGGGCSAEMQC